MRQANIIAGAVALLWLFAFLMNWQAWSAATGAYSGARLGMADIGLQLILPLLAVVGIAMAAWFCNSRGRGEAQLAFLSAALFVALFPYLVASVGVV